MTIGWHSTPAAAQETIPRLGEVEVETQRLEEENRRIEEEIRLMSG